MNLSVKTQEDTCQKIRLNDDSVSVELIEAHDQQLLPQSMPTYTQHARTKVFHMNSTYTIQFWSVNHLVRTNVAKFLHHRIQPCLQLFAIDSHRKA